MLEQPQTGLISRFYRQVENRLKKVFEWSISKEVPMRSEGKYLQNMLTLNMITYLFVLFFPFHPTQSVT